MASFPSLLTKNQIIGILDEEDLEQVCQVHRAGRGIRKDTRVILFPSFRREGGGNHGFG